MIKCVMNGGNHETGANHLFHRHEGHPVRVVRDMQGPEAFSFGAVQTIQSG